MFHGKGGYDHNTVYNMPIWLRKFTLRQIVEFYDKEKRNYEKNTDSSKAKTVIDSEGNVKLPEFLKNPAKKSRYNVEGRTSKK